METLSLDLVYWQPWFALSKSSLGQIMRSISKIRYRAKKGNKFQMEVYPKLNFLIKQLIKDFNEVLDYENDFEYKVNLYNLIGTLPRGMSINDDEHDRILLDSKEIGEFIVAALQRIDYILNREMPIMYRDRRGLEDAFRKMQNKLLEFKYILKEFENQYKKIVLN